MNLIMVASPTDQGLGAAALVFQDFRHFAASGVLLEMAENGEESAAHADFGHAVQAAGSAGDLLTWGV